MGGECPCCGAPLEGGACSYCDYVKPQETQYNGMENGYANSQGNNYGYTNEVLLNNVNVYPNQQYTEVCSPKSKMLALVLCFLAGYLGLHRFYVGKFGTGIVWFLTAGCFGFGWIVDIIMIAIGVFRDSTGLPLKR